MNVIDTSRWPSAEDLALRNRKGESWSAIGDSLNASRTAVRRYIRCGNIATTIATDEDVDPRPAIMASNDAFVDRMLSAIEAGEEKGEVGIKVDKTPSNARVIRAPFVWSSCGSPAALCADAGSTDGADLNYA